MTQLGLEGMPRRLFSCTPSRLTGWADCPRRYRMTYLDRPPAQKGPPWAHNTVGAVVHLALARWWSLPRERRTPSGARALLEAAWKTDGFRDAEQAEVWRARAGDLVEGYVATLDPDDEPLGVERTVSVKSAVLAVSGRVDRIDLRDGQVVVVDYKTGRGHLTEDDARGSLALALYALACARTLRKECAAVELHHLPTGEVLRWEHAPEALLRHLARAEALGEAAADATEALVEGGDPDALFPARPGRQCGWCDVRRSCAVGQAQGAPPQQPWAGLAEQTDSRQTDSRRTP